MQCSYPRFAIVASCLDTAVDLMEPLANNCKGNEVLMDLMFRLSVIDGLGAMD